MCMCCCHTKNNKLYKKWKDENMSIGFTKLSIWTVCTVGMINLETKYHWLLIEREVLLMYERLWMNMFQNIFWQINLVIISICLKQTFFYIFLSQHMVSQGWPVNNSQGMLFVSILFSILVVLKFDNIYSNNLQSINTTNIMLCHTK